MNYKNYLLIFLIIIGCEKKINNSNNLYQQSYSNNGFTLIYNKNLLNQKIVSRKINDRSMIVFNSYLKKNTPIKITNLLNDKYLLAHVGDKSKYPYFYNSVISERIAIELEIDPLQPYIRIETLNERNSFVANKAKTFDEEKKVADKAPVDSISIENLGSEVNQITSKKEKEIIKFNYIIKIADLFFENSALLLQERLIEEFGINQVKVEKVSENLHRVFIGPFEDLDSLKKEFINSKKLNFENLEIIKL